MDVGRRKGAARSGVVAGSVWESRMRIDEVQGGIKVFNGEENSEAEGDRSVGVQMDKKLRPKQSIVAGGSGKRKTWKSEEGPIQIARQRSEVSKSVDEQCKELSVSTDGLKRSPIQMKKTRSEVGKELTTSVDGIERIPVQRMKARSEEAKELSVSADGIQKSPIQSRKLKSEGGESGDGIRRNPIQLRKAKSELSKSMEESVDGNGKNSLQLRKVKSELYESGKKTPDSLADGTERNPVEPVNAKLETSRNVDESNKGLDVCVVEIEKSPSINTKIGSDETCKELDVCKEKVISSSLSNVGQVKSAPQPVDDDDGEEVEDWDEELEEEVEEEIEKKSFDIKEINIPERKPKQVVTQEKKFHVAKEKSVPISPIVKKQTPPIVSHSRIHPTPTKTTPNQVPIEFQREPETHSKLQSLVDLVMWRDVSRSAFIFGIGSFIIFSSSYTKDLNISLITVVSYMGLVYLALIFLYRSIVCRGVIDTVDTSHGYVVGEDEAIWLLELILPYLNEFLLKLRALFSGEPATTMKLAILLFVLARCGSSITIWKMAKLGFFGVFIVPKICSSYSTQLAAFGTFWVRRFCDAWESCSHKKAVAFAIFTLVWNLSSIVARIWAVFMLFVAFRYYQQSVMRDDWMEEEVGGETSWNGLGHGRGGHGRGPTLQQLKKTKKAS